jgi:hypothetical protein
LSVSISVTSLVCLQYVLPVSFIFLLLSEVLPTFISLF